MAKMIEREPEWIATAPIRVSNTRRIEAPAEAVWAFIADHGGWPVWFTDLGRVEITLGATGVGGGRAVTIGRVVTMRERFTAWDPPRRFAFTVVEGPYPVQSLAEMVTIEPDGGACTVTYEQGMEARRGFGPVASLVAKKLNSATAAALSRLAELATA